MARKKDKLKAKEPPPTIRSSFAQEERVKAASKVLRRPERKPVEERPAARLGDDELGTLRLLAGKLADPVNLHAFVMEERKRKKYGVPLRRCEDGDLVMIAVSLAGEAVPLVMCWNEDARAFEDPISGSLFRFLVDCYILLKPGSRRRAEGRLDG